MVPQIPFSICTATAPTGSSTCNLLSTNHTPNITSRPETAPITAAPAQSVTSQGAVIATRPAREAFRHMEISGLPYLIHVKIIHTTVATAGATVVVRNTLPSVGISVAAAPLNPYQPNHRINTPRAPITRLQPGKALTFVILPSLSFVNLPIRGPSMAAPIRAQIPPTI